MEAAIGEFVRGFFVEAGAAGDVGLAAEDRLDALLVGLLVEFDGAEHVAVVGDRQGGHFVLLGQVDDGIETAGTVKERVLAMGMQMHVIYEVAHGINIAPQHGWVNALLRFINVKQKIVNNVRGKSEECDNGAGSGGGRRRSRVDKC